MTKTANPPSFIQHQKPWLSNGIIIICPTSLQRKNTLLDNNDLALKNLFT